MLYQLDDAMNSLICDFHKMALLIFSDAPASLALMIVTHSLTVSSKLEIGNFACLPVLAPPLSYSIGWEYLSGLSSQSGQSGLSGLSGQSDHPGQSSHLA